MPKYIFLDNWVLQDYTKDDKSKTLSDFITENDYTILINSLSLSELYNPNWQNATIPERERGYRAANFLAEHKCSITDPQQIFISEIGKQQKLEDIPILYDLQKMQTEHRKDALLGILRRDPMFLAQGVDIQLWASNLRELKSKWLGLRATILDNAIKNSTLHQTKNSNFTHLESDKVPFLLSLDSRHFISLDNEQISQTQFEKLLAGIFPAIRITSLCFWYMYVAVDPSHIFSAKPSDIADFYQISMIPYCDIFTVDGTMFKLLKRIDNDVKYTCQVLDQTALSDRLKTNTL